MAAPEPEKTEEFWKTPEGITQRVDTLVQVFSHRVVNNAIKVIAPTNGAKWLAWILHPERSESGPCPICIGYSKGGRNGYYRITWFLPEMPAHPGCFTPETLVDTSRGLIPIRDVIIGDYVLTHRNRYRRVRQTHRRSFEGDIHRLMGNGLTGNHPVLTPDGWRSADSLNEGNKVVVSTLRVEREPSTANFESYEIPASIAEEYLFTPVLRPLALGIMPVAPVNLDGQLDLGKGEVEVVDLKGILRHDLNSVGRENSEELLLKRRHITGPLSSRGLSDPLLTPGFPPPRGLMGGSNLGLSLLGSHPTPTQGLGLTLTPDRNFRRLKSGADGSPADSEMPGDSILGHTLFDVEPHNLNYGQINAECHQMTPTLNDIYINHYKGFVHNLTVAEDESYAVGEARLLVHNCVCEWEIFFETPDIGKDEVERSRILLSDPHLRMGTRRR